MANEYPTPAFGGPLPNNYFKHPLDFSEITVFSTYEDKGVDTNESADTAPQRWTLRYDGITKASAQTILSHYNTNRLSERFTFQEPRHDNWPVTTGVGTTYTNTVQYESPVEMAEHEHADIISLVVRLVLYP